MFQTEENDIRIKQWRKQVMKVKKEQGRAEEDGNGRRWNKKTGGDKEESRRIREGEIGEGQISR